MGNGVVGVIKVRENGGKMQTGLIKNIKGGKVEKLEGAPSEQSKDWVVLIKKL